MRSSGLGVRRRRQAARVLFGNGQSGESESGLDLQTLGFTIVAERFNYWRYLSHFRSIHRGAFFTQLRTTTVRKLLHTPTRGAFSAPYTRPMARRADCSTT